MELPIYLIIVFFIIGVSVGSFINVVAYRFPRGKSFIRPSSSCPSCNEIIKAIDLVPLLSFLLLKGRCRNCESGIGFRYFAVELISGLIFMAVPIFKGISLSSLSELFLLSLLLAISLIDIDFKRIPNVFLVFGFIVGLLFKLSDPAFNSRESWNDTGTGMLVGGGIMLVIYIFGRGGIGAGDLKLMVMIGFYLGFQGTLLTLLTGFIVGGFYGLLMIILRRLNRKDMIPFGPFLSLGVLIFIFFGERIINFYTKSFL